MNGILQWEQQLRSRAEHLSQIAPSLNQNLDALQSNSINVNTAILALYVIALLINREADRVVALLAFSLCALVSYTTIYELLSGMQYHFVFAFVYINLMLVIKQTPVKIAVLSIGLFQTAMAWDSLVNATIETFIYTHYEITICLLHSIVIGYFLKSDFIRIKQYIKRLMCSCAMFVRN
jgi:hypothetical protein